MHGDCVDLPFMAPSNVVLLLIGLHGVGKSTFIRAATGDRSIRVGTGVGACTEKCAKYRFHQPVMIDGCSSDFNFTIIDTPGLADKNSNEQNLEVLARIADQLRNLGQAKVSGVIYFHSIENVRLHGVDMDNIRLLKAICGAPFFPRVAFVTTRWDRMKDGNQEKLMQRNAELEEARKELLPDGPQIFKFLNDGKSHNDVLDFFARKGSVVEEPLLLFARELQEYRSRNSRRAVGKTTAGKQIAKKGKVRKKGGGICTFL